MEIPSEETIKLWKNTDAQLRGSERRKFRAGVVRTLGKGGQCYVQHALNWSRETVRLGEHELRSGVDCQDQFQLRGRKPVEYHLPHLLVDLKAILEPNSQTDPTFKSTRVYTPLTAESVRTRLIDEHGYKDSELPSVRTLRKKINQLGFDLKKSKNASR